MTTTGDTMTTWTDCYAIPGENQIIDVIHPVTGLTIHHGETSDQVQARHPGAVRVTWEAWQESATKRQRTPITWSLTTESQYHEMLECLPPERWKGGAFLVGEPTDHDWGTGRGRFAAFICLGDRYLVSDRPITVQEFDALHAEGFPDAQRVALISYAAQAVEEIDADELEAHR